MNEVGIAIKYVVILSVEEVSSMVTSGKNDTFRYLLCRKSRLHSDSLIPSKYI